MTKATNHERNQRRKLYKAFEKRDEFFTKIYVEKDVNDLVYCTSGACKLLRLKVKEKPRTNHKKENVTSGVN